MANIMMTICKIKGIEKGIIELPIENGLYAIVGNNGSGKSTIMSCLAQLVSRHNLGLLKPEDYDKDSYVEFIYEGKKDTWFCENGFWKSDIFPDSLKINGTYEGSLFYGMRFRDSKNVDELMENGEIDGKDIVEADAYIKEKLGEILHNDPNYYKSLRRIKNKYIAEALSLKNTPYFFATSKSLISQYRMSSGECLLISLLHFIYNSIVRRSLPASQPILLLIDEIELALHPVAIMNLLDLLKELIDGYSNLTIIITSHSPEVIRKIEPKCIYKLERISNEENNFSVVNPCYPSYAIRDVYAHDGFDYLLLVEDELAKLIVKTALKEMNLTNSRLVNVLPVGGWENVLKLQRELISNNILGIGKSVFSILDGDVSGKVGKEYKNLKKMFLPISSVEKYLREILLIRPNVKIKKEINDNFFQIESLEEILKMYKNSEKVISQERGEKYCEDSDGKRLYKVLIKGLEKQRISEESFIQGLYDIIRNNVDLKEFYLTLKRSLGHLD